MVLRSSVANRINFVVVVSDLVTKEFGANKNLSKLGGFLILPLAAFVRIRIYSICKYFGSLVFRVPVAIFGGNIKLSCLII